MIPEQGRMGRPRKKDRRRVFEAIQFMLASGYQWLPIPPYAGWAASHGAGSGRPLCGADRGSD